MVYSHRLLLYTKKGKYTIGILIFCKIYKFTQKKSGGGMVLYIIFLLHKILSKKYLQSQKM